MHLKDFLPSTEENNEVTDNTENRCLVDTMKSFRILGNENVYEDVKTLLKTFPNTEKDLDGLETAWVYGARILMKPSKDDQEKDNKIENLQREVTRLKKLCTRLEGETVVDCTARDDIFYSDDEEDPEEGVQDESVSVFTKPNNVAGPMNTVMKPLRPLSYSSVAEKLPDPQNPKTKDTKSKAEPKSPDPELKPNFAHPTDRQVRFGPVPGRLGQGDVYQGMKGIFLARGAVRHLYLRPDLVLESGKMVRYGLVVFEERRDAEKMVREGSVKLMNKHIVKLTKFE